MRPKHLDQVCFLQRFSTSAGFLFTGYRLKVHLQENGNGSLDEVVQTLTVSRENATLTRAPNTGAYLRSSEKRHAHAWCFISREGDISTVYLRPEARDMGLGRETVREELKRSLFIGNLSWHMFCLRTRSVSGCVNHQELEEYLTLPGSLY